MKTSIYETITSKIITSLEFGVKPWNCPWQRSINGGLPTNHKTGKAYRGINVIALWLAALENEFNSNEWMTFEQIKSLNFYLKKGSKGAHGIKFGFGEKEVESGEKVEYMFSKSFVVFNLDQIEGLEITTQEIKIEHNEIFNKIIARLNVSVINFGDKAFYSPVSDSITLPDQWRFSCTADYYATLIHEIAHWTGPRLDREFGKYGDEKYAKEELVAELTAAFVMAELNICGECQHENYIAAWLKAMKGDVKYVYSAAKEAAKAADFILGRAEILQKAA